MATVTKLKAAVDNKNLPILGVDGNLYNYYVGRYTNKIGELGYTPTSTEISALNAFIEKGIEDGWIDKLEYFMPFIGLESTPLTGMVPLVDKVADYELAVETVDADLFSYYNGKIISFGNPLIEKKNLSVKLPVKTSDIGNNSYAPYFNVKILNSHIENHTLLRTCTCETSDGVRMFMTRISYYDSQYLFRIEARQLPSDIEPQSRSVNGFNIEYPGEIGVFASRYNNNGTKYKQYVCYKDRSTPLKNDMYGASTTSNYSIGDYNYYLGFNFTSVKIPNMNVFGILNPLNLVESDMKKFNQAVFALTAALNKGV
jgi:hypothetical protein